MSGHSKWANIKRQKAVVDAKKGAIYARMAREIIVAAKLGGADINANFKLRQAVERAKAEGVPNDNIARAIEKGAGSGSAMNLEELMYEGYGPGGVAIIVRSTTDNRNRTAGDIRCFFSKYGGNLGESGCVSWLFIERGEIKVEKNSRFDDDKLLNCALDAGAEDVEELSENPITIICQAMRVELVSAALSGAGLKVLSAEVSLSPKSTVEISDRETGKQLLRLLDALENQEDVQQVYANFDMDSDWMQEFLS